MFPDASGNRGQIPISAARAVEFHVRQVQMDALEHAEESHR